MKIRSITTFANPGFPINENLFQELGAFNQLAKRAFAGYEVQTTRLASIPFPVLMGACETSDVLTFAQTMENASLANGYDYVSIGPALPEVPQSFHVLPEVFAATENVFAAGVIASKKGGISLEGIRLSAQVMVKLKSLDPNGFGNLYFAALANVNPLAPFFPAAYHSGGKAGFAIATEGASLAVEAFTAAKTLLEARKNLVIMMEAHAQILENAGRTLAAETGLAFYGLDLTLAPFPEQASSIGTALEQLGVSALGLNGSLAAAAFLADAMDRAKYTRTGFNGLMLPVLEDYVLAQRAADSSLTVNDLLLYSAVCGTGLDTIPLPGDTSQEQLAALLLDLAALAQRLDKPLTARLMPVPGKKAGEMTEFNFPFFANSRVMALRADRVGGLLENAKNFNLERRS